MNSSIDTGQYTYGKKRAIHPSMFKWRTIADDEPFSEYATVFKCDDTSFIAYLISRENIGILRNSMQNGVGGFTDTFKPLQNNYGVYILIGNKLASNHIYIGQAGYRDKDTKGIGRLFEHYSSQSEPYKDLWDKAVYITSTNFDWGKDDIGVIEKLLIDIYKKDSNYDTFNASESPGGNAKNVSYVTKISAILSLMALPKIKRPTDIEYLKVDEDYVLEEQVEALSNEKDKLQAENDRLKNSLETADKYAKFGVLYDRYIKFKEGLKNADKLEYTKGKICLPDPYTGAIIKSKVEHLTPYKFAKYKVDKLSAELFSSKTIFIDPVCKSAVYLIAIAERLMSDDESLPINHEPEYKDRLVRFKHIVSEQLFGVAVTEFSYLYANYKMMEYLDSKASVLNQNKPPIDWFVELPNIETISNYIERVKTGYYGKHTDGRDKTFRELLCDTFKRDDMKFDVVIGNPPYNDDLYLDFVKLGHKLSNHYDSWVIPSKWQTKTGKKNEEFRSQYVKHIKEITYFPNSEDIFDIWLTAGICYIVADKDEHDIKQVENICNVNTNLNGKTLMDIRGIYGTCNLYIVRSIVDKIYKNSKGIGILRAERDYTRTFEDDKKYIVKMNWALSWGGLLTKGNTFVTEPSEVVLNHWTEKTPSNAIWFKGTEAECNSFKSYIDTRLIRFIIFMYISGQTINGEIWKYIPDPGAFDHIFTDKELYDEYNLTDEEISIIESIIKKR